MRLLQRVWLASLALLVASALPSLAADKGRGAPRQNEKDESASRDRGRDKDEEKAEAKRRDDDQRDRSDTPEWRRPANPPAQTPERGQNPYNPNGVPYNNGNYPSYGTAMVAEAVIQHSNPNRVNASLGAVGEPFRAVSVRFSESNYDIVRQRNENNGRYNPHNDANNQRNATAEIDLSRYSQWMDGRREWFLRLEDRNGEGGQLLSFVIRTDRGTYSVRNVPAYFGPDRRLEARLTPISGGYSGGYPNQNPAPYPNDGGYPYPSPQGDGYPGPSNQNQVERTMPNQGYAGQRVTLQYRVNSNYGNVGRVELTETLPPSGWQVVQAQPQPRYIDQRSGRVTWDLTGAQTGQAIILELIVPRIEGYQRFKGTYRFDGGQELAIGGMRDILIGGNGSGYPSGSGYNQPTYSVPGLAEVLGTIFGQATGINGR